jgi:hypothetical protein
MITSCKLRKWTCSTYSWIIGEELFVDHQLTIVHQTAVVDRYRKNTDII